MTGGRRSIVVGQVVASALALALVYFTLLSPGDDSPLFGVEAPNQVVPGDGSADGKRTAKGGDGGNADDAGGTAEGGGGGGESVAPGTVVDNLVDNALPPAGCGEFCRQPGGGGGGGGDEPDADGPPAIQYRSTLSQIRARLEPE